VCECVPNTTICSDRCESFASGRSIRDQRLKSYEQSTGESFAYCKQQTDCICIDIFVAIEEYLFPSFQCVDPLHHESCTPFCVCDIFSYHLRCIRNPLLLAHDSCVPDLRKLLQKTSMFFRTESVKHSKALIISRMTFVCVARCANIIRIRTNIGIFEYRIGREKTPRLSRVSKTGR
jgi:hypothetical protein